MVSKDRAMARWWLERRKIWFDFLKKHEIFFQTYIIQYFPTLRRWGCISVCLPQWDFFPKFLELRLKSWKTYLEKITFSKSCNNYPELAIFQKDHLLVLENSTQIGLHVLKRASKGLIAGALDTILTLSARITKSLCPSAPGITFCAPLRWEKKSFIFLTGEALVHKKKGWNKYIWPLLNLMLHFVDNGHTTL